MKDALEKVISQARRIDVVALLQELVRIPSPTGEEGAVQALVQKRFADAGLEMEAFEANLEELREHPAYSAPRFSLEKGYAGRPNVLGRMRGAGGGRSLLLFCHADTVPPWSAKLPGPGIHSGARWKTITSMDGDQETPSRGWPS